MYEYTCISKTMLNEKQVTKGDKRKHSTYIGLKPDKTMQHIVMATYICENTEEKQKND